MVKQFLITLTEEGAHYAPGSTVSGSVIVEVEEPKKYDQIRVSVSGEGSVSWSRGTGEDSVLHSSRETYLSLESILWASSHTEDGSLPRGKHSFPFQFTLPASCPSSFKCLSKGGQISYQVEAVIHTGQLRLDHRLSRELTVIEQVHVDTSQSQPVRKEHREKISYLCCSYGDITITAEVSRSRFMVGQEMDVQVYVENGSGRQVTPRCELVENVLFYAENASNWTVIPILQHTGGAVAPHSTSGALSVRFLIPPDTRPALATPNIKSSHAVKVTLEMSFSFNPVLIIPVIISNA